MVQAHLVAPLGCVGAPDDIAPGYQWAWLFKFTQGLLAVGGEEVEAQPVVARVLHHQIDLACRVRPLQVNPHLASKAWQLLLGTIHGSLRGFAGDNRRQWVAVANHGYTAGAKRLVTFLPAHLQGEVLTLFPRGVA